MQAYSADLVPANQGALNQAPLAYPDAYLRMLSALRPKYNSEKRECDYLKIIIKDLQGETSIHEWRRPALGKLVVEHDGHRTRVEEFGLFGGSISSYVTYEILISIITEG